MTYSDKVLYILDQILNHRPYEGCMGSSKKVFGDLIEKLNEKDSTCADEPK